MEAQNQSEDLSEWEVRIALLEAENARLRQSNHALQDAIAFTGHDWRNQVTQMILAIDRLLKESNGTLTDPQKSQLQRIRQGTITMQRIARNYLTLSQTGAAHSLIVKPVYVNPVRDIIEPLLANYADLLEERCVTTQIKYAHPDLLVWADPALLSRVYDNLIHNAIQYGEQGGRIVFQLEEQGHADELSVWNSGPGISPEQKERVLERFFSNGETALGNTGLGLYLARAIVEAHGGSLRVESKQGAWANFVFTLPKREARFRNRIQFNPVES